MKAKDILRRTLLLAACACFSLSGRAQSETESFVLMEYNVENLFDTVHAEGKHDVEFTPQGERKWDTRRYRHKLSMLARAIISASDGVPPTVVGLCEVENDSVLRDLTQRTRLARAYYSYICTSSSDVRGINVALLYDPLRFRPVSVDTFSVFLGADVRPTRDVLHVAGLLTSGDTLDIVVCHLPSRMGGRRHTEPSRMRVAECLRTLTDSIMTVRTRGGVVLMGDFNDDLAARPLRQTLGARPARGIFLPAKLYDVCCRRQGKNVPQGTYKFRRRWQHIDHVLLSGTLLMGAHSLRAATDCASTLSPDFLLESDGEHGVRPRRTFLGPVYHGGTSDHLPTVVRFTLQR
ncbi:MAG: endonuclease [Alloprevotella sp.]|nr:endonuclease [Alloprevotella sp.]